MINPTTIRIKFLKLITDLFFQTVLNMKKRIYFNKNEDVSDFGNDFRKSFTYILLKYHSNNPREFTFEDLLHEARTIMVGVSKIFFVYDNSCC